MVMAGNENAPGALADDALSARLQWLRQRREALQEKLAQKNSELKNLCVEEAEITGVLPPEIPLEPGESPPTFRRKDITFIYPQKSVNVLKTADTEESELELEKQVQLEIMETALNIVNDSTESKATRRKHRFAYQQSQRRLQELETELNFIRQSRGKTHRSAQLPIHTGNYNTQSHSHVNVKHRTKKPRPPLDSTGNEISTPKFAGRGILHEPGISLSPLGPEDKCIPDKPNTYSGHSYEEQSNISNICNHHYHSGTYPGASPVDHSNIKMVEHDHNENHNIYILSDQYRVRTYSHGSGGSRGHYPDTERTYRPYMPNTYTEDERQMRYRQLQHLQQKQLQESHRSQYTGSIEYKHLDNADIVRRTSQGTYEKDFRASHYTPITDYQVHYKNSAHAQPLLRRDRDSSSSSGKNIPRHTAISNASIETQLLSGYWVRHNDDIHWVSVDEPDRFGSLDRRRRNAYYNSSGANSDVQSRYRTVAVTGVKGTASSNIVTSSQQHHSVHLLPLAEQQMPLANSNHNKMLLRTQSLGSVETWQSNYFHDSHDGKDAPAAEYPNNNNNNNNRKNRQKEWYETSVDSGASAGLDRNLIVAHKNTVAYQSSPPPVRIKTGNENGKDNQSGAALPNMSPVNRHNRDKSEECRQLTKQPHARYDQSVTRPKMLEIPAESKPSLDVCDDAIRPPLGSPQNCTVVQPGKYQPYREVTKPFEMSDFYKYSTKFRKRNEAATQSQTRNDSPLQENRPTEISSSDLSRNPNTYNFAQNIDNVTASPVQRRLYQPVQRMTCQPYLSSLR
ncbi:FERM domain-containing protein 4A [Camponotus floridanus]|uniref:FERM domain-containing protein 4A n=1 Tax=Camponotus floridanus TaxID=104421 RepID=E2AZ50_CAMFO|nr:FERM domain-containing protein 4A [Camponotus floridanus]